MRKLIRLLVACSIRNSDEYYQKAIASMGIDYTKLSHGQITAWKAVSRVIEADLLIEAAFDKNKSALKDYDMRDEIEAGRRALAEKP
jgi:hypothetical protein